MSLTCIRLTNEEERKYIIMLIVSEDDTAVGCRFLTRREKFEVTTKKNWGMTKTIFL